MSANAMPSGRGRLPGMGSAATPALTPASESSAGTPAPQPPRRRSGASRRSSTNGSSAETSPTTTAPDRPSAALRSAATIDGPYAGETKVQVNPRIYASIWQHYEELVEQLPRAQRRGALTALVNAVLAHGAPQTAQEALAAITALRQAETRPRPE